MNLIRRMAREAMRLRGELLMLAGCVTVFIAVGISRANFEVIIFKLAVVAMASIFAHIIRQLGFNYVCLEDCIFGEERFAGVPVAIRAAVIGGIFLVYAAIVYSVTAAA